MANTAGHIKITVSPDLRKFREEVEQGLRDIDNWRGRSLLDVLYGQDPKQAERVGEQLGAAIARGRDRAIERAAASGGARARSSTGKSLSRLKAEIDLRNKKRIELERELAKVRSGERGKARRSRTAHATNEFKTREERLDLAAARRNTRQIELDALKVDGIERRAAARRNQASKTAAAATRRRTEAQRKRETEKVEAEQAKAAANAVLDAATTQARAKLAQTSVARAVPADRDQPWRHLSRAQQTLSEFPPVNSEARERGDTLVAAARQTDRAGNQLNRLYRDLTRSNSAYEATLDRLALALAENATGRTRRRLENASREAAGRLDLLDEQINTVKANLELRRAELADAARKYNTVNKLRSREDLDEIEAYTRNMVLSRISPGAGDPALIRIQPALQKLAARNGSFRQLPRDVEANQALLKSALDLDRAESAYQRVFAKREKLTSQVRTAMLDLNQAKEDGEDPSRVEALTESYVRLKSTLESVEREYVNIEADRLSRTATFNKADSDVSGRTRASRLVRTFERIDFHVVDNVREVISRVILLGRTLASITQIASTAAMALAAVGAVRLVPLISSATQALSVFAALPAVIAGVATGVTAMVTGMGGIGAAIKAANDAAESSETDRTASRRRARDAEQSYSRAQESAARTYVAGQRQIASAEKSVASAIKSSQTAQESLTKARQSAIEKLRNLNDTLRGTALNERSAVLAQKRARQNMTDLFKNGGDGVTPLDVEEAQLAIDQADYDVDTARKTNRDTHDDAAEMRAKGIEGSDEVVAAREALADANDRLADAQQNVAETIESVGQANADAQQSITDAWERLNDAWTDLTSTTKDDKLAKAMAKLSPNAKALVRDIVALKPAWEQVKWAAQDALTNGAGDAIRKFVDAQLPIVRGGFTAINAEIGTGFKSSLEVLSSDKARSDYAKFFTNTTGGFHGLARAAAPLTQLFVDLATAGSSVLPQLGDALADASQRWSEKIALRRETGELNLSIDRGIDKMVELGQIVASTFGGVRGVFAALRGDGDTMTASLVETTAKFEAWAKSAAGAEKVRAVFDAINDIASKVGDIITGIAGALSTVLGPSLDNLGITLDVVATMAKTIQAVADALMGFGPTAALITTAITALASLYAMKSLGSLLGGIGTGSRFTDYRRNATNAFSSVQSSLRDTTAAMRSDYASTYALMRGDTRSFVDDSRTNHNRLTSVAGAAYSTMHTGFSRAMTNIQTAATTAFTNIRSSASGLVSALGGGWALALTGAIVAFSAISSKWDEVQADIATRTNLGVDYQRSGLRWSIQLQEALNNSNGAIDEGVRAAMLDRVQTLQSNLNTESGLSPNKWDYLTAEFGDFFSGNSAYLGDNLDDSAVYGLDKNRAAANAAKAAKAALDEAGLKTDLDISKAIFGTKEEWAALNGQLNELGNGGQDAAARLGELRDEFLRSQTAANRLKSNVSDIRAGYLEAADAVDKLTQNLAKQRRNSQTTEDSQTTAFEARDALNSFTPKDGGGEVFTDGRINLESENGREFYRLLTQVQSGYDSLAAASIQASLARGESDQQAIESAQGATAAITSAITDRITSLGLEGEAVNALVERYRLSASQINTIFGTEKSNTPTVPANPDYSDKSKLGPVFGPNGSMPAGQGKADPAPAATTAPAPAPAVTTAPAQAPAVAPAPQTPDYAAATKSYTDYVKAIEDGYNKQLLPAFDGAIDKSSKLGSAMVDAIAAATPKFEEFVGAISGLNLVFKSEIAEGALIEWSKLRPAMDADLAVLVDHGLPNLVRGLDELATKFKSVSTDSTASFAGIKKAVADPINWLITNVFNTALKNAWNEVRKTLPSLPEWTAVIPTISGYSRGGIIPGYQPGVDDRIVAVGKGEAIMRPEFVRAYGSDWIHRMNAAARNGGVSAVHRIQGAFANGGIVDSMESAVKERWPNMQLTSGLRFTDTGYHSTGQAADFSDGTDSTPTMRQLAAWFAQNFQSSTLELIHSPFNKNIKNGRDVGDGMSFYGRATMDEHRNHVHVALAKALGDMSEVVMPALGGDLFGAAGAKVQELLTGPMAELAKQVPTGASNLEKLPRAIFDAVAGAATGAAGKSMDAGNVAFDIGAGAAQWRDKVIAALIREGFEPNERNIGLTLAQIQSESGGNPNIIQQVQDVNSGGNEAVGLLQVIPGTFARWRNPALPNDRSDPDANISAALRYYRAKWGEDLGAMWGQGHGYDQGGWLPHGGFGWNMSGKPEPVFTNDQWVTMSGLLQQLAKLAPGVSSLTAPSGPAEFVESFVKVVKAVVDRINSLTKKESGQEDSQSTTGSDSATSTTEADDSTTSTADSPANTGADDASTQAGVPASEPGAGTDTGTRFDGGEGTGEGTQSEDKAKANGTSSSGVQLGFGPVPGAQTTNADGTTTDPYLAAALEIRKPEYYANKWRDVPSKFAEANWNQFTSDLGITGEGSLSQLVKLHRNDDNNIGVDYIQKKATEAFTGAKQAVEQHVHYHVTNIDEAIRKNAIRQRQDASSFMR